MEAAQLLTRAEGDMTRLFVCCCPLLLWLASSPQTDVCVCVCARARATHTHRRLPRSTNHFYCPEYRTPALASDYNTYTGMTLECMREDRRGRCCAKTGDTGMYAAQLRRWFRVFRRDQFLILNSQLLNRNQTDTIVRLGRFLGLAASAQGALGSKGAGDGRRG